MTNEISETLIKFYKRLNIQEVTYVRLGHIMIELGGFYTSAKVMRFMFLSFFIYESFRKDVVKQLKELP